MTKYKLSKEAADPATAAILLHKLDIQATYHLTTERLYRLDCICASKLGLCSHQRPHLPWTLPTVERTQMTRPFRMLMLKWYIFKGRVETYLGALVPTALLRKKEVVIDHITQLLLLLVLRQTKHADPRRNILPRWSLKQRRVIRQRIPLTRWKTRFWRDVDRVILLIMGIET